ncbi:DUF3147 family protein [Sphingomicrobium sp. XHP0235]|uniref:DUF3147 family protein n=1 Tax=Sphingomicrobium aquimarinum TaxID=3133971 RepID=UPI0031FE4E3D
MLSFIAKAAFAGVVTALIVAIAKRYPSWGGLVAALPLTSILALSLLYYDTRDGEKVAALSTSILAFILPSIPFFILLPTLLRQGVSFGVSMTVGVAATLALYALSFYGLSRLGFRV